MKCLKNYRFMELLRFICCSTSQMENQTSDEPKQSTEGTKSFLCPVRESVLEANSPSASVLLLAFPVFSRRSRRKQKKFCQRVLSISNPQGAFPDKGCLRWDDKNRIFHILSEKFNATAGADHSKFLVGDNFKGWDNELFRRLDLIPEEK